MPTYGYECKACGIGFEAFQKITDDALTTCQECGGELKKKIYPVGIVFKGSGFYVNDYANKGAKKDDAAAPASTSEATDSAASTKDSSTTEPAPVAASTESKPPDPKPEAKPVASTPAATASS